MSTVWIIKLEHCHQENSSVDECEDLVSVIRPTLDQLIEYVNNKYDEDVRLEFSYETEVFSKYDIKVLDRDKVIVIYVEKAEMIEFA